MTKRIPEAAVDEVLARTDIRATIEPYVSLQSRGGRYWGLCPFHKEKTPSFSVSPQDGLFYCFGCHAGGSVLQFLMRIEGWSFVETVRELAQRSGVRLPELEESREAAQRRSKKDVYLRVMELACQFYEAQLRTQRGEVAVEYLKGRSVDGQTAKSFRLGFAPDDWSALMGALRAKQADPREVEEAGLVLPRKSGGHYDRFRNRVMFPVVDRMGRVVAFSGRALGPVDKQKYINSPEVPYFKKGEHLYGIHAAKEALRMTREAILVEGNFDVVTLHAAGINTVVAPLGTALTVSQARLLKRVSDSVVIVFDGDEAGQRAMIKAIGPCYEVELPVKAALLPEGEDPDTFVRSHGKAAFEALLGRARPLAEVALDRIIRPAVGMSPELRVQAGRSAGKLLQVIPKGALRRSYTEEAARRLELRPRDLVVAKTTRRQGTQVTPAQAEPTAKLSAKERLMVQLLIDDPSLVATFAQDRQLSETVRPALRPFLSALEEAAQGGEILRRERLMDEYEGPLRGPLLEAIFAPREYDTRDKEAIRKTLWQLQWDRVKQIKRQIQEELRAAEREDDQARLSDLENRDRQLTRELNDLQRQHTRG